MKLLFVLILAILLAGCASVSVDRTAPDGSHTKVKYMTFSREVENLKAEYGGFSMELGSAGNSPNAVLACMLAPELPGCKP